MNRILACVFLSLGTILVVYGLNALHSPGTAFARLLSGAPPEDALWFLLAGIAAVLVGAGGLFRLQKIQPFKSRRSHQNVPRARTRPGNP